MDREFLKKAIADTLGTINEQFEILGAYKNKVPRIELDIVKSNIQRLYEYVLELEDEPQDVSEEQQMPEDKNMPDDQKVQEEKNTPEEPKIPEDQNETEDQNAPEPLVGHEPEDQNAPEPLTGNEPVPAIDLFSSPGSTLADKLKKEEENILVNKMNVEKGPDLRSGIGINEKFMFINELFEGSMQEYDEALTAFNHCQSQDEAVSLITSLSDKFSWHEDTNTKLEFIGLVNRRYQ